MIIYTLQRKETLNTLQVPEKPFRPDIQELYEKFFKMAGLNCKQAFWGWSRLQGTEVSSLSESKMIEYLQSGPQPGTWEDKVLIKLDVPNDEVVLSNYYEWSDIIYFTLEEPDEANAQISWRVLFDTNPFTSKGNTDEVQATFSKIKPEWILSVAPYSF